MPKIITKQEAIDKGLKKYFTGKPCLRGHLSYRWVSTRRCYECNKVGVQLNRKANPERTKTQKKKDDKKYYEKNKKELLKKQVAYLKGQGKEKRKKFLKEWYPKYYEKNKERIYLVAQEYLRKNKNKVYERHNKYRRNKRENDIEFKIADNLRRRVNQALRHSSVEKTSSTRKLIGCSVKTLIKHLEKQFTEGMSWKNHSYRGWHIDHIVPVAYFQKNFDFNDEKVQKMCFNYKNLRPMWAKDNQKKGSKYIG